MKMKPMLAAHEFPDIQTLSYPLMASAKIDGCRAVVKNGKLLSRKLEYFPNNYAHQLFDRPELNGFDGELTLGSCLDDQVRNRTSGFLNSLDKVGAPGIDLTLWAFDLWDEPGSFEERYAKLRNKHERLNVNVLPHATVSSSSELIKLEDDMLALGYEGLILRAMDAPYKFGRSTLKQGWMLKLKRFVDAEAQVLRVNEEMQNTNRAEKDNLGRTKRSKKKAGLKGKGRAGELEVRVLNGPFAGVECVIPLGAAGDKGKDEWWARRDDKRLPIITFKYFPKGAKDKPLLPTYVGIREGWDR